MKNNQRISGLKAILFAAAVLFTWMVTGPAAPAQTPSDESTASGPAPIDVTADSLEYLDDQQMLIASGNVTIRDGEATLRADYMTVQTESRDVYARGNVIYTKGAKTWQGDEFSYNLRTREGDFGTFTSYFEPFYLSADDSRRISTNEYELENLQISTCEGERPPLYARARSGRLVDDRVYAKGVTFYAGFVPFFYLPSYSKSLGPHTAYFEIMPGYSSRQGAFLLTAYHIRFNKYFKTITHADYRHERGVGLGQDFEWIDGGEDGDWNGAFRSYYINDDDPFINADEEENRTEDLLDNERYRLKLSHFQMFTDRDYLIGELNYLSDPFILEDFFNEEFRNNVQPENRVTLTHRGDHYTAALLFNKRLNDFYENVDRLPELTLDVNRQQIGDSGFYYESENSAAYLERVFPEGTPVEDYDAFRIDSGHTVFYPTRNFGFLNIIPRAGYRGTYYSSTVESGTFSNNLVLTQPDGSVIVTNDTGTFVREGDADFRNVYQLGWEGSFKAFKAWEDLIVLGDGDGLRHIAEPYLDHTWVDEPNLLPSDLPQFDTVDTLDKRHDIKLGMRNKLQTRRDGIPVDLVDFDVFSFYRVEKEEEQEDFSEIFFDTELRLVPWLPIDFDGAYDQYEGEFTRFSIQGHYYLEDFSRFSVEYRYAKDTRSLVTGEMILFPDAKWSFEAYVRYDDELGELEEHSYFVKHTGRCIGTGLGFRQIDDDTEVWLQLWLTAFPESAIDMGI